MYTLKCSLTQYISLGLGLTNIVGWVDDTQGTMDIFGQYARKAEELQVSYLVAKILLNDIMEAFIQSLPF